MAKRYADYIKMQDFLPVYDMTAEKPNLWKTFIPTKQFCDLLSRSITAFTSSEIGKRRSMWVRGTFGTGKSHASSVVRHLLCDPYDTIADYLENLPDDALREQVKAIRTSKRYFPVVLKGVEGAYNISRFKLSLQRETKKALANAGYDMVVKSDFTEALDWVEKHKSRISELLENNDELASEASNYDKLVARLQSNDIDVFLHLEEALAADKTYLTSDNISDWLVDVQQKIAEEGIADGLIIFWDEFTSVMDTLQSDRINVLQNIAEKSQMNNVFLFLISHRTERTSFDAKGKDITKMSDRYDSVDYAMDEISTYLILRHTFTLTNKKELNIASWSTKHSVDSKVFDYLCGSTDTQEKEHIQNLFPLHPYTAFLCSKISNIMGSANRTVLKFMNDEKNGFAAFINDSTNFELKMMLTADWLWDFFYSEFADDPHCAAFINVYSSNKEKVNLMGDDYLRVFKVILLLNALGMKFKGKAPEKYAPNDKNLGYIFSGDRCEEKLLSILDWLDENHVVARDILGEFKIAVATYNTAELTKEKMETASNYKDAISFLNYNDASKQELRKIFLVGETLMRKCEPQFYSCEDSEAVLRSKLKKYTSEKPNFLHVALFFAITDEARDMMENRVKEFSEDFTDTLFIIPSEVFTESAKNHFIDTVAQANLSRSHFNNDDTSQLERAANEYVVKWKSRMVGGTYNLYYQGERSSDGIFGNVYNVINKRYSAQLFPLGMESIKPLHKESMTFFANKNYKKLALQMLQKRTREEMLKFTGSDIPSKLIFIEGENNLVNDACELTKWAKQGDSWLNSICSEVDKLIEAAKKKYNDRFALSEVLAKLMQPPYGMFPNHANYVALAFALRKHKDDLFNPSTSQPVGDEKLTDMITHLLQMWDNGVSEPSNKLLLRFGSAEEKNLSKTLGEIFNLQDVRGVNIADMKSLRYANWAISEFCKQIAQYPLWSLLYCDAIKEKPEQEKALNDLIYLFSQDSYPLSKIKELYNEIKGQQIDLYKLIAKQSNYQEGFTNFINSINDVDIKEEWWPELEDELNHLQSEIAFRKKEDVKDCVNSFYIRKIKELTTPTSSGQEHPSTDEEDVATTIQKTDPDIVRQAKNCVRSQTMPSMMWQKVVLDLLEKHPEVSDFLIEYLGR